MKIKNKILFLLLFCLFSLFSFGQTIQYGYQIVQSFTIPGTQTGAIIGSGAVFHQLTWNVSGSLPTCSVTVDSSPDGSTWTVGGILTAQTCTSNGQVLSASVNSNYVRINVSTLTGTGTLTINLTGYSSSPNGGGGSSVFPLTISGTVNSGGLPYFSSTTVESSSALLTQFGVLFGGGAGGAPTSSAQGAANMPLLGNGAANPVFSTVAYPTSAVSGCIVFASSTTALGCGTLVGINRLIKSNGAGSSPLASTILDGATAGLTIDTNFLVGANTVRLTANATAITALTPGTIVLTTGALPVSTNLSFHCHVLYNQQTAAVAGTGFAIQGATNAPTRLDAWGNMYTSNAGVQVEGSAPNITTTTATPVVSGTPSAITTVFQTEIAGTVQTGASATTLNLLAFTGNASDSITIQAGSYCSVSP